MWKFHEVLYCKQMNSMHIKVVTAYVELKNPGSIPSFLYL